MTIKDVKIEFQNRLSKLYETNELNSLFYITLEHYGYSKFDCISNPNLVISDTNNSSILETIKRLESNEPIQYILHKAYFREREFYVDSSVLIPRQETEYLIQYILENQSNTQPLILDLGTGSGIIAISLALEITNSTVYALDISNKALEVAKKNAENLNCNLTYILSDMRDFSIYNSLPDFNIIVSNPPYVCSNEKNTMKANVLNFEPHSALFVDDSNPLEFYTIIAEIASKKLQPNGYIYCEINEQFGLEVKKLFTDYGFTECIILKDLHEKDRFIVCKK